MREAIDCLAIMLVVFVIVGLFRHEKEIDAYISRSLASPVGCVSR